MDQGKAEIEVTLFKEQDGDAVRHLIRTVWQEVGSNDEPNQMPDLVAIGAYYGEGASNFWVAQDAQRVVGSVALKDLDGVVAAIKRMYVHPEYRGAAFGTGARLLEALVGWAREKGLDCLVLGTPDFLHRAHRFYEKSGFRSVGREELPASFHPDPIDTRFYRLDLR